jgi:hypothetical protein
LLWVYGWLDFVGMNEKALRLGVAGLFCSGFAFLGRALSGEIWLYGLTSHLKNFHSAQLFQTVQFSTQNMAFSVMSHFLRVGYHGELVTVSTLIIVEFGCPIQTK